MDKKTHTIDATNIALGRLAARISVLLRGKNTTDFAPNKEGDCLVVVKNIRKIKLTGKKLSKKVYYHHTGYMGGLKEVKMEKLFKENPGEILKKAVYGMLPKNKLRSRQIKRLRIE